MRHRHARGAAAPLLPGGPGRDLPLTSADLPSTQPLPNLPRPALDAVSPPRLFPATHPASPRPSSHVLPASPPAGHPRVPATHNDHLQRGRATILLFVRDATLTLPARNPALLLISLILRPFPPRCICSICFLVVTEMHVTIFGVYTAEYENWGEAVRGCELSDQPPPHACADARACPRCCVCRSCSDSCTSQLARTLRTKAARTPTRHLGTRA